VLRRRANERHHFGARSRIEAGLRDDRARDLPLDRRVDVVAAEERVAGRRDDLDDVVTHLQQRQVERATTEVIDRKSLARGCTEAIREGRRGRLVEDAEDLEACLLRGATRGRALQVVEVRGDRDDGAIDLLPQRVLGDLFCPLDDHRRDRGQRELAGARSDHRLLLRALDELEGKAPLRLLDLGRPPLTTDQALDREERVLGVDHATLARFASDEDATIGVVRDHAGQEVGAGLVGEHACFTVRAVSDDGVGGPEIDADGSAHRVAPERISQLLLGHFLGSASVNGTPLVAARQRSHRPAP
jgi:hypothetical protein